MIKANYAKKSRHWLLFAGLLVVSLIASGMFSKEIDDSLEAAATVKPVHRTKAATGSDSVEKKPRDPRVSEKFQRGPKKDRVQVAWIMSFGGSGTSYTITNTQKSTNTTTATNYGADFDPCVPVHPEFKDGPFLHKPMMKLPPKYVLTKTHCGGYCMDCSPQGYIHTADSFDESCRTGQRNDNGTKTTVTYTSSIPKKAIHLIRNPFDNLVGRMHLATKVKSKRPNESKELISKLTSDRQGLSNWCAYLDSKYKEKEIKSGNEYLQKYQDVPCHAEWFRYVQWHNRAIEVTQRRELPVYYLYYDNYTLNYEDTVNEVFDFLKVERVRSPVEFRRGKTYDNFFSPEHAKGAAKMAKDMASPEAWQLLKHFFVKWLQDDTANTKENDTIPSGTKKEESRPQKTKGNASLLSAAEKGKSRPQVAWLMSFPNSGTSYTMMNTERMSNLTTATNYAGDLETNVPVRPEWKDGPFVHKPTEYDVPVSYILTKTHCAGYCDDCPPRGYISTLSSFERGCRTGEKLGENGEHRVKAVYSSDVPKKAVHLIRSPFDNLIARLHLAVKKRKRLGWTEEQLASFAHSRDGYLAWCEYLDNKFGERIQRSSLINSISKELFRGLPCYADWYRYVQWHNLAIETTDRLHLPVHYLYYENYTSSYDDTVDSLFDFLELRKAKKPLPFIPGKTYLHFFSDDEARAAARLVEHMASPTCWKLIGHYFDQWLKPKIKDEI